MPPVNFFGNLEKFGQPKLSKIVKIALCQTRFSLQIFKWTRALWPN
jgi:hypothetical protein